MAGFRRSTWFALGILIGGIVGGAFGLFVASGAMSSLCRRRRDGASSSDDN
jgi:gas vesicle protein